MSSVARNGAQYCPICLAFRGIDIKCPIDFLKILLSSHLVDHAACTCAYEARYFALDIEVYKII